MSCNAVIHNDTQQHPIDAEQPHHHVAVEHVMERIRPTRLTVHKNDASLTKRQKVLLMTSVSFMDVSSRQSTKRLKCVRNRTLPMSTLMALSVANFGHHGTCHQRTTQFKVMLVISHRTTQNAGACLCRQVITVELQKKVARMIRCWRWLYHLKRRLDVNGVTTIL